MHDGPVRINFIQVLVDEFMSKMDLDVILRNRSKYWEGKVYEKRYFLSLDTSMTEQSI